MTQARVITSTTTEAITIHTWPQGTLINLSLTSLANKTSSTITTIRAITTLTSTTIQAWMIITVINSILTMQASEAILTQTMWLVVVIVLMAQAAILACEVSAQIELFSAVWSLEVGRTGTREAGS